MARVNKTSDDPYTDHADSVRAAQRQAERLAHSLGESAQQVWLAGIGALGRAQSEGSKLFESLVQEGASMERNTREFADRQAEAARSNVDNARTRAVEGWDRLERAFEDRVQRTLSRLGVPVRDDLSELSRRIDELTAELRRSNAAPALRATARKASRTSAHASPAKKATTRKSVRRPGGGTPDPGA